MLLVQESVRKTDRKVGLARVEPAAESVHQFALSPSFLEDPSTDDEKDFESIGSPKLIVGPEACECLTEDAVNRRLE
jgi:hypothetical protein